MLREAFIIKTGIKWETIPQGVGSRILPGFSQLRGWEMVFVMGGVKKHKITSHFLKLPP